MPPRKVKEKERKKKQRLLKEKFGKLKEDIDLTQEPVELEDVELEEGDPEVFPLRRETQSIEDLRKEARKVVATSEKPPLPRSRPPSRELTPTGSGRVPTPPTSGRTTPVRQQSGRRNVVTPPPIPLQQNFVEGRGAVEEFEEDEPEPEPEPSGSFNQFLDGLKDSGQTSFHSRPQNLIASPTFSFVDTDGIIGDRETAGKFKGKEVVIVAINKGAKGRVVFQLKDNIGKGIKVDEQKRGSMTYRIFKSHIEDLNLKPLNP